MSIAKFDHLYIETRSFSESLEFWKALGFEIAEEWGDGDHRAAKLQSGDAAIVLAIGDQATPAVFFRVSGIEAVASSLEGAQSIKIRQPLESTHWGTRWIIVEDPNGNAFCLEE